MTALLTLLLLQATPTDEWSGFDGWVLMMRRGEMQLLDKWSEVNASDTTIVVFGRAPKSGDRIHRFVDRGGRLLVASDHDSINSTLHPYGVTLHPGPIMAPSAEDAFHGYTDCPLLRLDRGYGLLREVRLLAFNRAGWLTSHRLKSRGRVHGRTFLMSGRHSRGHVTVISDHSVFINLMLLEAGNRKLAENVIDRVKRPNVLFLHDGRIIGPSSLPPGMPPIPGTLAALNPALRQLETSGKLDELAGQAWPWALAGATGILLALIVIWLFRRPPETTIDGPLLQTFYESSGRTGRNYRIAAEKLKEKTPEPDSFLSRWRLRKFRRVPDFVSEKQYRKMQAAATWILKAQAAK